MIIQQNVIHLRLFPIQNQQIDLLHILRSQPSVRLEHIDLAVNTLTRRFQSNCKPIIQSKYMLPSYNSSISTLCAYTNQYYCFKSTQSATIVHLSNTTLRFDMARSLQAQLAINDLFFNDQSAHHDDIFDSQSDFAMNDRDFTEFMTDEAKSTKDEVDCPAASPIPIEQTYPFTEQHIKQLSYLCNHKFRSEEQPTAGQIEQAIRSLHKSFPNVKLLDLAHKLYVSMIIQRRKIFARPTYASYSVTLKDQERTQHGNQVNNFNINGNEMLSVKCNNPTKRVYRRKKDKQLMQTNQKISQKQNSQQGSEFNLKSNPYMKRNGGWQWDVNGNRVRTTAAKTMVNLKPPFVSSTGTYRKGEHRNNFCPSLIVQCKMIKTIDGKLTLSNKNTLTKKFPLLTRFNTIKDIKDYRFIEREIAARAFCDRGYGIPMLRAQIKESKVPIQIDDKRYKAVSTAFVAQAFRKMQIFLKEDCKQQIRTANAQQLKVLFTILLNCRDCFDEKQARTFVKYVKLTYELGEVEITQDETMLLYNRFMASMQDKVKIQRFDPQKGTFEVMKQSKMVSEGTGWPSPAELWNRPRELQFYDIYLSTRSLKQVRNYFRARYDPELIKSGKERFDGEYSMAFFQAITDMKMLTSKFHKTIRSGLRRVQVYAQRTLDVPRLKRVSDDVVKRMFCSPDGVNLRRVIFELQKLDSLQSTIVTEAVEVVNGFIDSVQGRKSTVGEDRTIQETYVVNF